MHILAIAACPFPWPRGTPIRIHRLNESLSQRGHHIDVATYHLGDRSQSLPFRVQRSPAVPYYQKTTPGPSLTKLLLLNPLLLRTALQMLRSRHYDLIHAHHIEALLVCRWLRRFGIRLPVIYDAHTLVGEELMSYLPDKLALLARPLSRWFDINLPGKADHIITVTEQLRDFFVDHHCRPDKNVTIVINGIERTFIDKAERLDQPGHSWCQSDDINIVFAGNLTRYQNIDLLLNSFVYVRQALPTARLRLLTQDDFSPYQTLLKSCGLSDAVDIEPVSFADLPAALLKARVLVNPRTVCSGIPQKLLNYMGSGRPIVSFSGSAQLIQHRVSALIVENGDVRAFADAIIELVESPPLAFSLAQQARRLVRDRYSWDAAAVQIEQIYQSLLGSKNIS